MGKIPKTRVVLKDATGSFWRLCNISDLVDSHKEPYLKIMLPEFKNGIFTSGVGFREKDGLSKKSKSNKDINCSPESISYHYMVGLRHLKERSGNVIATNRSFPNIIKAKKSIAICRFAITDFKSLAKLPTADPNQDILPRRNKNTSSDWLIY
jgi:hypothetical protein